MLIIIFAQQRARGGSRTPKIFSLTVKEFFFNEAPSSVIRTHLKNKPGRIKKKKVCLKVTEERLSKGNVGDMKTSRRFGEGFKPPRACELEESDAFSCWRGTWEQGFMVLLTPQCEQTTSNFNKQLHKYQFRSDRISSWPGVSLC